MVSKVAVLLALSQAAPARPHDATAGCASSSPALWPATICPGYTERAGGTGPGPQPSFHTGRSFQTWRITKHWARAFRRTAGAWASRRNSLPELDKALALCRVFGVSADLLLQGSPSPQQRALAAGAARRLLPAAGTALVALGLVYICAAWYERQLATDIAVGMAAQAFGLILQYAAGLFEKVPGHRRLWRADFALCTFVPASLLVTTLLRGYPRPYASFGVLTLGSFLLVYASANVWFWWKTSR